MTTITTTKTTIIERGIRTKSMSPVTNVKQQLNAFVDQSNNGRQELGISLFLIVLNS
jgi:hypothetical protein